MSTPPSCTAPSRGSPSRYEIHWLTLVEKGVTVGARSRLHAGIGKLLDFWESWRENVSVEPLWAGLQRETLMMETGVNIDRALLIEGDDTIAVRSPRLRYGGHLQAHVLQWPGVTRRIDPPLPFS